LRTSGILETMRGRSQQLASISVWILALLGTCNSAGSDPVWIDVSSGLSGVVPGVGQLVIDRGTGTAFYALTSGGSIFKSTDSGSSWKALGNIVGVNAIALSPAASPAVYAGTAHGVVRSADGGQSWGQTGLSDVAINVLAVDAHTPSTLYASGSAGTIYRSVDGGADWTSASVDSFPNQSGAAIAFIAIDPFTPSILYALSGGPRGTLYKSTDGGHSWSIISAANVYASVLVTDPALPSTLYANLDGAGLSKSTDGGTTWAATGLNDFPIALAIDPANSNTLYASTASDTSQAILKSTDGGKTWSAIDTISAVVATAIPVTRSLVFAPNESVYVTSGAGIFKSADGGITWAESDAGLRIHDIRTVIGGPLNPSILYGGDNNGLFQSKDGGAMWTQLATFQILPPVSPVPGIGSPFPPLAVPTEVNSLLIDFTNPNTLYLGTARPGGCYSGDILLFKSTDGGTTWNDLSPTTDDHQPLRSGCEVHRVPTMDPIDSKTLYLPYGDDYDGFTILKTTDEGANWKNLYAGLLGDVSWVNALLIDRNTPTTLYAATDLGVLRSTDGGANFLPTGLANTPVAFLAIDPFHPNVLYAATSNNPYPLDNNPPGLVGLYKSTDGGATWSPMNQGLDRVLAANATVNALLVDSDSPNILYLATSGYGVFKSSDGGATWAAFNNGLTSLDVGSLALVRPGRERHRGREIGALAPATLYAGTSVGVFAIRQETIGQLFSGATDREEHAGSDPIGASAIITSQRCGQPFSVLARCSV
jgi:photosystem II stability/assembly factor-like uncharacterized protein